jgi:Protein of unknown function (DUF3568)
MGAMNSSKIRLWLQASAVAAVLSVVALNSGCVVAVAGAAAGAGTVAWVEGKLVVTLGNSYDQVTRATDTAIAQLQFFKLSDERDALTTTVTVRTAEDKKVTVEVKRVADQLTKVEIRVGAFGDKPVEQAVYDRIRANL